MTGGASSTEIAWTLVDVLNGAVPAPAAVHDRSFDLAAQRLGHIAQGDHEFYADHLVNGRPQQFVVEAQEHYSLIIATGLLDRAQDAAVYADLPGAVAVVVADAGDDPQAHDLAAQLRQQQQAVQFIVRLSDQVVPHV